jgi:5-methyltetrahydropteroyltriglutamate--homocysteine methyltransferase
MANPILPTTTVGSMPKPGWLAADWFSVAGSWRLTGETLREAQDDATRLALADQERAGIDIVCDGEQRRPSHFSYFLTQLDGVDCAKLRPRMRRGGTSTLDVPCVVGSISLARHTTLADYRYLRALTQRPIKMTLPGPMTLVDGAVDEYYGDERTLAFAFADVLNAELQALIAAGCEIVQLDEPAFTRMPQKVHAWGAEALDRAFAGAGAKSAVHICYGYSSLQRGGKQWKHGYDEILPLLAKTGVERFSLEFAEPNLPARVLEMLPDKTIELGVIDVGAEQVETPDEVAARLRVALEVVPAERLVPATDCGCVALPRNVACAKLTALVAGTRIVRDELGLMQPPPGS